MHTEEKPCKFNGDIERLNCASTALLVAFDSRLRGNGRGGIGSVGKCEILPALERCVSIGCVRIFNDYDMSCSLGITITFICSRKPFVIAR